MDVPISPFLVTESPLLENLKFKLWTLKTLGFAQCSCISMISILLTKGIEISFSFGNLSAYGSKWQAFKLATLSGFAEPLGVVIVGMSI